LPHTPKILFSLFFGVQVVFGRKLDFDFGCSVESHLYANQGCFDAIERAARVSWHPKSMVLALKEPWVACDGTSQLTWRTTFAASTDISQSLADISKIRHGSLR